jgi:hypothetical protein
MNKIFIIDLDNGEGGSIDILLSCEKVERLNQSTIQLDGNVIIDLGNKSFDVLEAADWQLKNSFFDKIKKE